MPGSPCLCLREPPPAYPPPRIWFEWGFFNVSELYFFTRMIENIGSIWSSESHFYVWYCSPEDSLLCQALFWLEQSLRRRSSQSQGKRPRQGRSQGNKEADEGGVSISYCQTPEKLSLRMRGRPLDWLVWFLESGACGPGRRTTED